LTRAGGQSLLFGLNSNQLNQLQQYDITRRELTIHGVYVGSHVFPRAVRILERSGIDFTPMITTYPLEKVHDAIENLRAGQDVKTIIEVS
jgi:threonine dehydrogenase-like Zn-dependent dehydrogenase